MSTDIREIIQSPLRQGVDEQIAYQLTVTPWGSDPTTPVVVIKNQAGDDVTDDLATGSAAIVGDVITTPIIHSLSAGQVYRLEIKFTISGNVLEAYSTLIAEV